jgi:hypothetical protein
MTRTIDGKEFRLYATFMKKGEARSSATTLRDSMRPLTRRSTERYPRARVVPTKIKGKKGHYSGGFTVYCVYVERR